MIKIIGIGFVLGGVLCGILTWDSGKKEKIRLIQDMIDFLRQAEGAVEHQMPMIEFLKTYACAEEKNEPERMKENPFRNAIREFAFELEKYEWGSGGEAWKSVLNKNQERWNFNQDQWNLNEEQWKAVVQIGMIANGRSRKVLLEILTQLKIQFMEMEQAESRRLSEQRKVIMPVGMLAGVMLVLIFI